MDKIFKIGLLVLGFSYLAYLFCPVANQVGRYSYHEENNTISAFDTTTGLLYRLDNLYASFSDGHGRVVDIIGLAEIATEFTEIEEKEYMEKLLKKEIKIKEDK